MHVSQTNEDGEIMSNNYLRPEDEQEEAKNRIDQIRQGGGQSSSRGSSDSYDDSVDLGESEVLSRTRGRAASARARLGSDTSRMGAPRTAETASSPRYSQALLWIGGFVLAGIVLVLLLVLVAPILRGQPINIPGFATSTPTSTATPPATDTPTPTLTLTPTRVAPQLALPPLTCIFQSGAGCFDYCQIADNLSECNSAKSFVRAQGADPDVWFQCLSPGTGPNQGNPQDCLRQAWYAANP
jgi:hypothetical protein